MYSYLFMRKMENRPRSYDRRMNKISLGHIKSVKENVIREIPENAQVLEIGCGTGELATMLLTRGGNYYGLRRQSGDGCSGPGKSKKQGSQKQTHHQRDGD